MDARQLATAKTLKPNMIGDKSGYGRRGPLELPMGDKPLTLGKR